MELEQELVNLFIDNTQYDMKFISDLINILKSHLGKGVKILVDVDGHGHYYYSMTDNLYIVVYQIGHSFFSILIVYKLVKIILDYVPKQHFNINICRIEYIDRELLKLYFDNDYFLLFNNTLFKYETEECKKELRDVFIPISVKSARK